MILNALRAISFDMLDFPSFVSTLKKDLIAAPFTPMLPNGDVNMEMIAPYAKCLREQGVRNVYLNGTTGEGLSLTVDERKRITEEWMKVGEMDTVMAMVGANCIKEVQELAQHAEACGVNAIAVLPPLFYKPQVVNMFKTLRYKHYAG